ncbi:hypothetical protein [Prauserella muralis]|uniref:Uncharacterized protein n=1 Tax=Prauserella muralis TaxID=588067 RepID=A0A2V4AZA7_9PSEU|nr:hypothetical protein [Prauserella muralis]PXY21270.1 hypothetical protein BAY60_27860 [Prauserella muralis]TWE30384.1 hypothetical protein FHX69_3084 [Prauserella muralis]
MAGGRPSWLFESGASPREKGLAHAVALAGVAALALAGRDLGWAWWQWLVGVVLVYDLAGGVVANALDSTQRFYHSPLPFAGNALQRFVHHPVGLTAAHVQPVVAGLVFPGGAWWWGPLWYCWALAGAVVAHRADPRWQRPLAMAVTTCGVLAAPLVAAPPGLAWLPAVLLLKLVLAHGVVHLGQRVTS